MAKTKTSVVVPILLLLLVQTLFGQIHGAAIAPNKSEESKANPKPLQIKWIVLPESSKEAEDLRSLLLRNEHTQEKKSLFDNAVHTIPGLDYLVQKVESAFQSGNQSPLYPAGQSFIPEMGNLGGGGSSLFGSQSVIERPASSGFFGGISSIIHGLEEKGQNLFSGTNSGSVPPDQGFSNYGMQPQQMQQQQQPSFGSQSPGFLNQGYPGSPPQQMGFNQGQSPMGPNIQGPGMGIGMGMGSPQAPFNQIPPVRYPQPGGSPYMGNLMQPPQFRTYFTTVQKQNSPQLRLISPVSDSVVERERNEKIVKIYRVLPLFNQYPALPVSKEEV